MSHSVTITRTTTSTTNTSYIVLNTGYLKTFPGLLKLFELIIGVAIVTIMAINFDARYFATYRPQDLFHYLMATTFMIGTFCLFLACLTSLSTGGLIAKTIYELIYHSVAAILLVVSSALLLIKLKDYKHDSYMAAGILGLVNAVLYFISAFLAHRSYRGI
ncbi:uncharacterized protein LOC132797228 [Drosophila nasuta]|uniref:Uncharacterized protein LOC117571963 n=1 Tax=Drosophila albomicans TaxID=7291 RepID=A0A6P8XCJ1_DROAB|nr:uncharacterized protein LOC117571963 [Drosophila albomicans]XP_060664816.1 uncharacterized protein LOC132797228 [Drosophila nasuta]